MDLFICYTPQLKLDQGINFFSHLPFMSFFEAELQNMTFKTVSHEKIPSH